MTTMLTLITNIPIFKWFLLTHVRYAIFRMISVVELNITQ